MPPLGIRDLAAATAASDLAATLADGATAGDGYTFVTAATAITSANAHIAPRPAGPKCVAR